MNNWSSFQGDAIGGTDPLFTAFNVDTNPDAFGGTFSGGFRPSLLHEGVSGFGPGDYSGNYTGEGDRVYWGPYDDSSSSSPSVASNSVNQLLPPHFGPGGLVQEVVQGGGESVANASNTVSNASSTGETVLNPPSQTTSVDAPPSSTGETVLNPPSQTTSVDGALWGSTDAPDGLPDLPGDGDSTAYGSQTEVLSAGTDTAVSGDDDVFSHARYSIEDDLSEQMRSGGDGSVEMTTFKSHSAEDIFRRRYSSDTFWDPAKAIAEEYGISVQQARGSAFESLRDELDKLYYSNDIYDGDSYHGGGDDAVEVQTQANTESILGGDLPDLPAGGEIEMQMLTPGGEEDAPSFLDSEASQRPTPLGDTPDGFSLKGSDGAPMLLEDMPSSTESSFSWDMLSADDIKSSSVLTEALTEGLSSSDSISLGAAGISSDLGVVGGFLKNRAIDLVAGTALMPLFNWIDDATENPWTSRSIQGALAMYGLIAGGDPFGVIAMPITIGIQEYIKQRQRLIANKDPEAERGKKFGYVREGDKWYPAIQTYKERDEGWVGSNKTQVTFAYGNEIKWRQDKRGEWVPYFEAGQYRTKNFHVSDAETDNPDSEAGEIYQKRNDPLRDFYYLTEEETAQYLYNLMGGSIAWNAQQGHTFTDEEKAAIQAAQGKAFTDFGSNVLDDVSWNDWWAQNYPEETEVYSRVGAYVDQLQDIRQSLDFMQSYRYSEPGSVHTTDNTMDEFEGSRDFRDVVNSGGSFASPLWDNKLTACNPMMGCYDRGYKYVNASEMGRLEGQSAEEMQAQGTKTFQDTEEMRWLTDEFYRQKDLLYKAQKAAGNSMNFNERFGSKMDSNLHQWFRDSEGNLKESTSKWRGMQEGVPNNLRTAAWGIYQDNSWGFGALDTSEQLQAAITKIEASGQDQFIGTNNYRNAQQRNYLAQKAYCRYLFSKINAMGGYDYMNGFGDKPLGAFSRIEYRKDDENRYSGDFSLQPVIGLDPMYSDVDDRQDWLGERKYGVQTIIHRDDYDPGANTTDINRGVYGNDVSVRESLRLAGILDNHGEQNPDYVAGRFDDNLDFDDAMGVENFPWDPVKQTYVRMGDQTPGLVYNDDTQEYEYPPDWQDPSKPRTDDLDEGVDTTAVFGDGGWGAAPSTDYSFVATPPNFIYLEDAGVFVAPDGTSFEDESKAWDYYDKLQAEQAAADQAAADQAAADEAEADDKKADADAEISNNQTVPDSGNEGTHVHGDAEHGDTEHGDGDAPPRPVYHSYPVEQHPIQHFAPDETAPKHIPSAVKVI